MLNVPECQAAVQGAAPALSSPESEQPCQERSRLSKLESWHRDSLSMNYPLLKCGKHTHTWNLLMRCSNLCRKFGCKTPPQTDSFANSFGFELKWRTFQTASLLIQKSMCRKISNKQLLWRKKSTHFSTWRAMLKVYVNTNLYMWRKMQNANAKMKLLLNSRMVGSPFASEIIYLKNSLHSIDLISR